MASLLEMSDWGGTDAESLEKGMTHIFSDAGSIPLDIRDFKMKLVCCTSDDASVNFGTKTGLMTRLSVQRPWMVKIHFVNHRTELAIKEAIAETEFSKVDDFCYSAILVFYCTPHTITCLTVSAHAFCHMRVENLLKGPAHWSWHDIC